VTTLVRVKARALISLLASLAVAVAGCGEAEPPMSPPTPDRPTNGAEARVQKLMQFVRAPGPDTFREVGFAAEVSLGLGDRMLARRLAEDLMHADAWVIHPGPAGFRSRTGPFSALAVLADAGRISVAVGSYPDCVHVRELPPVPDLADLTRVSIRPAHDTFSTCILWWSVDLYIADYSGEIRGVTLDLWD
jgi:hypothetical protein